MLGKNNFKILREKKTIERAKAFCYNENPTIIIILCENPLQQSRYINCRCLSLLLPVEEVALVEQAAHSYNTQPVIKTAPSSNL